MRPPDGHRGFTERSLPSPKISDLALATCTEIGSTQSDLRERLACDPLMDTAGSPTDPQEIALHSGPAFVLRSNSLYYVRFPPPARSPPYMIL